MTKFVSIALGLQFFVTSLTNAQGVCDNLFLNTGVTHEICLQGNCYKEVESVWTFVKLSRFAFYPGDAVSIKAPAFKENRKNETEIITVEGIILHISDKENFQILTKNGIVSVFFDHNKTAEYVVLFKSEVKIGDNYMSNYDTMIDYLNIAANQAQKENPNSYLYFSIRRNKETLNIVAQIKVEELNGEYIYTFNSIDGQIIILKKSELDSIRERAVSFCIVSGIDFLQKP